MADFTPIKAADGLYVALFPAMYLNCTQTWGAGTLSHRNHQSDWTFPTNEYPYYACADMTCYMITESGYVWSTDEKVHTPSGDDYISVWVAHDNDAHRAIVGTKVKAGEILGHSGVRGYATGDHLHIDCALGQNVSSTGEALAGDRNPAEVFYITDDYTVVNTTADGITITFPVYQSVPTYALTVINGTPESTTGAEGTSVDITANEPEKGQRFFRWSLSSGVGTIEDSTKAETSFTFGEGDGEVTAEYRKVKNNDIVLWYIAPFIKNNQIV